MTDVRDCIIRIISQSAMWQTVFKGVERFRRSDRREYETMTMVIKRVRQEGRSLKLKRSLGT